MDSQQSVVEIKGVMPTASGCAIFLGNESKTFVIYVDQGIGSTISMTLNAVKKERPFTHDLIGHIFDGFQVEVERVLISDFEEGTYYARLILKMSNELGTKLVEIDARPSDCIVLALQRKRSIYVSSKVLDVVDDMSEILDKILKQQQDQMPGD
ncbi:MAG: bifunctional nuclease family protein [Verrucomicrobiota bacterium]